MWHVLFRTKYAGSSVSAQIIPFDSYEAAEDAIKALTRHQSELQSPIYTEVIRLYQ